MASSSAPVAGDLLVIGPIATLEGRHGFGWAEAMAIRGGRVLGAGARTDVEALLASGERPRRRTRVWQLSPGTAVLPGITDAHLHLVIAALAATQLDLSGISGRGETLAAVRAAHLERAAAGDGQGWLLGHGWSLDRLGGWPAARDLETAAPGRPIALWGHDHHSRWVSVAALNAAEIDGGRGSPQGGQIRLDERGQPTGILHENAATMVDAAIPSASREDVEQAILDYAPVLLGLGVTGVHDPGELVDDPESLALPLLLRAMAEGGRLPLRVTESIREGQLRRAVGWGMHTGRAVGRYRDGWLKLFSDGSLGSRSAALLEPYEADDPGGPPVGGPRGMPLRTPAQLAAAATEATRAGIAVQIHAIGDAAVRIALDVLGKLPAPDGGAMHRIEHAQLVDPQDVPRFAELGVAASVQPCHLCSDATTETVAWGARTAHSFPLRDLDLTGAVMPFGTDAPVEPPDPWRGIAAAVARRDRTWAAERGPFHPEQSIPIWRAIRAACLDPSLSVGAGDEGRLTAGSRADFSVVPSAGLATEDPTGAALAAIRPLATILDGDVVHRAAGFDPG